MLNMKWCSISSVIKEMKIKTMRYYFKRYLLACDYTEFVEWLDKYFNRSEIEAIASYLFEKSMNLWYTQEDDDEIIEKAIKNIEKYWFWYNCYTI